ncbi:MAG: diguanylate cyclase, partial [Planctomycetes bacterium]|nr:diguanylate cyclase [Planctomycetota bacterium]
MPGLNQSAKPDDVTGKILVLGDAEQVFVDGPSMDPDRFVVVSDRREWVAVAAQGDFQAIGVVLADGQERAAGLLKSLRDDGSAKLIVLARMTEEPLARRLTRQDIDGSGQPVADGYLVYPMVSTRLKELTERLCGVAHPAHHSDTVPDRFEERMRQLERLATEDDLTGLKNRRYIWEFAKQILERTRKEGGRVTLLVYDIDDFKRYNDVCGHPVGDRVLKEAAVLMSRCCRAHDVVGRIGGDEFAVVFWDDASDRKPTPEPDRPRHRAVPDLLHGRTQRDFRRNRAKRILCAVDLFGCFDHGAGLSPDPSLAVLYLGRAHRVSIDLYLFLHCETAGARHFRAGLFLALERFPGIDLGRVFDCLHHRCAQDRRVPKNRRADGGRQLLRVPRIELAGDPRAISRVRMGLPALIRRSARDLRAVCA